MKDSSIRVRPLDNVRKILHLDWTTFREDQTQRLIGEARTNLTFSSNHTITSLRNPTTHVVSPNGERAATVLSAAASLAASAMLFRTIASDLVPGEVHGYFSSTLHNIFRYLSSQHTIIIEEFKGNEVQGHTVNELFEAAEVYLGCESDVEVDFETSGVVRVWEHGREGRTFWLEDPDETVWSEERSYELSFNKKHKDKVLNSYFPYILERAKALKRKARPLRWILSLRWLYWRPRQLCEGESILQRMGKTGDAGTCCMPFRTGKSSLIAAIANHLNYDIYDMDLTGKTMERTEKIREEATTGDPHNPWDEDGWVTEDEVEAENQALGLLPNGHQFESPQGHWRFTRSLTSGPRGLVEVTLSGFLNLINGLLSCCSEEQILVFTTNHREQLDPALLRPGCIDMEIHMSYCTIGEGHTAEVAGELMKSKDAGVSLQGVIEFFHRRLNKMKQKQPKIMEAQKD
ncbi:Protein hyper-sensitivity-related 4 [Vitis vinifera]|uniref:Protein hyper-sensitivity-related 4 n=1 Tax=Vitis vinifera TaxID=29760 RepID=A0A438J3Y9_VITVI|nr:Protein hyper-sensitivity-related 4 [Vitis vinifera]